MIPRAALILRAVAAALLAAAVLGIAGRHPFAPPFYALVLDQSPSVERRLPGFTAEARRLWAGFHAGEHPTIEVAAAPESGEQARPLDLAAGLRAAAALAPAGVETRILLATDELPDAAGVDEFAATLRRRRVRVFALEAPASKPEARVVSLSAPDRAYLAETFPVRVGVAASRPGPVKVAFSRWGEPVAEGLVDVDDTGYGEIDFPQQIDRVGEVRYAAATPGPGSPALEAAVRVARSPSVLWLAGDPGSAAPLVELLRGLGVPVALAHPADLAIPEEDLKGRDVVVLDNVPAAALTVELLDALRAAVSGRGVGLLVVGGRTGLGSGEYADAPLEGDLPVRSGFRSPPPPPDAAMVLAIDTSFSMAFRGPGARVAHGTGPRKIDVARESAKGIVRVLRPGDRLGILGNSTDLFWIAPLGPIADPGPVLASLDAVKADGGGIFFYSVLHEAREALRHEPVGIRHLLVLCDTEDIDQYEIQGRGHSFDLVREMAREGISLSVVGIGRSADKDVPFLRTAALLGHGDFYLVRDMAALPRYLVSDYRRISSARNYLEGEVLVFPAAGTRAFGAAAPPPPLAGIALVTPREGAEVLLQSDIGAPVLVAGTLGRGRTAVFTGDNGLRWAERWANATGVRDLWLRMIYVVSPGEQRGQGVTSSLRIEAGTGRLLVQTQGRDAGLPPWPLLWARGQGEEPAPPLRLERVGLRSYRSREPLPGSGWRSVRVSEDEAGLQPLFAGGVREPLPAEDWPGAPRRDLVRRLAEFTGGGVVAAPEGLVPLRGGAWSEEHWTILLIGCAILCLLGEAVVRARREG